MCCLDQVIKTCTRSRYSHSALVVVDPPWSTSLKGVFVWESTWHGTPDPQDGIVELVTNIVHQGIEFLIRIHGLIRNPYPDRMVCHAAGAHIVEFGLH